MVSIETEIIKLEQLISDLQVSTDLKIGDLNLKIELLKNSSVTRTSDTVTPASAVLRHFTGLRDRYGEKIFIGDTVKFLTYGKYNSTQGIVTGFSSGKVIARDYQQRDIKRSSHNVRVVLENQK